MPFCVVPVTTAVPTHRLPENEVSVKLTTVPLGVVNQMLGWTELLIPLLFTVNNALQVTVPTLAGLGVTVMD